MDIEKKDSPPHPLEDTNHIQLCSGSGSGERVNVTAVAGCARSSFLRLPFYFSMATRFRHIAGSGVEVLIGGGSAREGLIAGDVSAASFGEVREEVVHGGAGFLRWE